MDSRTYTQNEEITKNCKNCSHYKVCDKKLALRYYGDNHDCTDYIQKLPEDSIVLTEREFLDNCELNYNKGYKQGSKEAVEKFVRDLLSVWDDLEKWSEKYYEPHSGITPKHIKEYAKQVDVEIKE